MIIPKGNDLQDPSQCHNISCTNFLSKILEGFVPSWAREEVVPKLNQYGGEPAASATQFLVEMDDQTACALEDNRAAVVLPSMDFSKAFNHLDHSKCLGGLKKRGMSTPVLSKILLNWMLNVCEGWQDKIITTPCQCQSTPGLGARLLLVQHGGR